MSAFEQGNAARRLEQPTTPTVERVNAPVDARVVHRGVARSHARVSDRLSRLNDLFARANDNAMEVPANDVSPEPEVERLSQDLLEEIDETPQVAVENPGMAANAYAQPKTQEAPTRSREEIDQALNAKQEAQRQMTERYQRLMELVAQEEASRKELEQERATAAAQRFTNAWASVRMDQLDQEMRQSRGQEMRARTQMAEMGPGLTRLNQDIEALEQERRALFGSASRIEEQERAEHAQRLAEQRTGPSEEQRQQWAEDRASRILEAREAIYNDIRELEQKGRALTEQLAALMQEQYTLQQAQKSQNGLFSRFTKAAGSFMEERRLQRETKRILAELKQNGDQVEALMTKANQLTK